MPKVYLHIGTPKTGTSAIQKALLDNSEYLEANGFMYPQHTVDPNGISSGNGAYLIHLMCIGKKEKAKLILHEFLNQAKGKSLILSSENFYRYPELTYELIPNAKIIVYIREQSEQIRADYNQSVKRHYQIYFLNQALNATLNKNDPFFNFELLFKWKELYGLSHMSVRKYNTDEFPENNIVFDFVDALGLSSAAVKCKTVQRVNISYHEDALRFKLWFNRLIKGQENRTKQLHDMLDYALQAYSYEVSNALTPLYRTYTPQQLQQIYEFYKSYNKKVADIFFPEESSPLFIQQEYDVKLKPYPGLSANKIKEIGNYLKNHDSNILESLQQIILQSKSINGMPAQAAKKIKPLLDLDKEGTGE